MKSQEDIEQRAKELGIIGCEDGSYENIGDFDSFRCYYCLSKFPTYDVKTQHEKETHKSGDASMQMLGYGL
jgi:hypothetical protein